MNLGFLHRLPRNARRFGDVVGTLTKYGLAEWLSHTGLERPKRFKFFRTSEGTPLTEESRATRIRLALTELGTTYIKFGQMLSTRPDIVGDEIASELAKLQEHVPADAPA